MAAAKEKAHRLTENEWIMSRLKKGPATPVAFFGARMPDYLTQRDVEAELLRLAKSGELRFGNGKWYRP